MFLHVCGKYRKIWPCSIWIVYTRDASLIISHEAIPATVQPIKPEAFPRASRRSAPLTLTATQTPQQQQQHQRPGSSPRCRTLTPLPDSAPTADWSPRHCSAGLVGQDAAQRGRVEGRGTLAPLSPSDVPMSAIRQMVLGCVSVRSHQAPAIRPKRPTKVRFGVPLSDSLKDEHLPSPLVDMLVYIAQHGVTTTDLFRRPGNSTEQRGIMKRMVEGKEVILTDYNFYTLASVIKKFLLKIPGGVFGADVEEQLLMVLDLDNRMEQYDAIHSIIASLSRASQELLSLLFGTWFRIVNHSEYNTMSSEAVSKSVAGSLFHTCQDDPMKIDRAVQLLQILIDDFGVANMFGRTNIQFFADRTQTGIRVRERFRYEYRYPAGGSTSSETSLQYFTQFLEKEAAKHGFGLESDAITEEEYYGARHQRRDTTGSQGSGVELRLPSSPPSPQSLQPQASEVDPEYNPHRKLTNVSSLSAPEVNKGYNSPTQDLANSKHKYLSTSLSRFDRVRRRQILQMKKRSNWFLSPNTSTSIETESALGSREASVGKCSIDAMSSDALLSDVTASDGAMSESRDAMRISSDLDSTFGEHEPLHRLHAHNNHHTPSPLHAAAQQQQQQQQQQQRLQAHSPSALSHSPASSEKSSRCASPQVTDRDVKYFMVEHVYGPPDDANS